MAARSTGSARIAIALVSIPVKLFTATSRKKVSFRMLHKCGSPLSQVMRCPVDDVEVKRDETVRAYEYQPDRFVQFTKEEIDAIVDAEQPDVIEVTEFVPARTIDPLFVEKSVYLAPDKGAQSAFTLFQTTLAREDVAGVGRWGERGLVMLRAHEDALVLHECFLGSEVRGTEDIEALEGKVEVTNTARQLASVLVRKMTRTRFNPARFYDRYAARVQAAVDAKVAGKEILAIPPEKAGRILTLEDALQRSVGKPKALAKNRARKRGSATAA